MFGTRSQGSVMSGPMQDPEAIARANRKAARDKKKAAAMEKINAKLVAANLPPATKTAVYGFCQTQLNNEDSDYSSDDPNDPVNKLLAGLGSLDVGKGADQDEASMRGLCDFMGKMGMGRRRKRRHGKTHKKVPKKKKHQTRRR